MKFLACCLSAIVASCGGPEDDPSPQTTGSCTPPPLLQLANIPDDPTLDDRDPETVAIFEVNGHQLIGKFVRDPAAAEGGLKLWQEIMLRIPENQLADLVQFEISRETDPVAYFNRTGDVTTKRSGLKIGFSTKTFEQNDPDPCAPLTPRRKTFDWSMVHEVGHLRGWLDGSWDRFLTTFGDLPGDGVGYPEDGSPTLERDAVTSYAERADGDEDYAESWTTFVMLSEDAVPPERAGEPMAATKVRWMASQPGLAELRKAIRITEPDGGNVTVPPAPRRQPGMPDMPGMPEPGVIEDLDVPAWIQGTWRGVGPAEQFGPGFEQQFTFTSDDVVEIQFVNGVETFRRSLLGLEAEGLLVRLEVNHRSDTTFGYNASLSNDPDQPLEDSFGFDAPDGRPQLYWSRLEGLISDVVLYKVP